MEKSLSTFSQYISTDGILKGLWAENQMTRASVSIASNIAEGAERNSVKEFQRFIHIAKGSAAELRTQLYIATKIKVITSQQSAELIEQTRIIAAQLQTLALNLKPKT